MSNSSSGRGIAGLCAIVRVIVLSLVLSVPASAQQTADVIRGRVTGPDSQPISGAQITAVSYFGGITKTSRTDKNGKFSITYANGEGDYWVSFAAIGYQARRFEVKRVADEEVLLADIKLSNAQTLAAVNVTANAARQTPGRTDAVPPDVAGNDKSIAGGMRCCGEGAVRRANIFTAYLREIFCILETQWQNARILTRQMADFRRTPCGTRRRRCSADSYGFRSAAMRLATPSRARKTNCVQPSGSASAALPPCAASRSKSREPSGCGVSSTSHLRRSMVDSPRSKSFSASGYVALLVKRNPSAEMAD